MLFVFTNLKIYRVNFPFYKNIFLFIEVLMNEMNDNGVFYSIDQIYDALSDDIVSIH